MNALDPLVTVHPGTGAFRSITSELLSETYLAPSPEPIDLDDILLDEAFPWASSMQVAPLETTASVFAALRALALATHSLDPDEIDCSKLEPETRLYKHLNALSDLWRHAPAALPQDLQVFAHVLSCGRPDALEPLPLATVHQCSFAAPLERRMQALILDHHGSAPQTDQKAWAAHRAPLMTGAIEGSSLWRVQQGLTGGAIAPGPLDETLAFFALRDEAEEADFAAARAQRLIDEGTSPADIGLLVPDEAGYFSHLQRAFDATGVPISGLPNQPVRRDIAGETVLQLLLCLQSPAPAMSLSSLYISPLMPWPMETGVGLAREIMRGRFEPSAARSLSGRSKRFYELVRSSVAQTPEGIAKALNAAARLLTEETEQHEEVAAFRSRLKALNSALSQSSTLDWSQLFRLATPTTPKPTPSEAFINGVSVFLEGSMPWRPTEHLIALGMSGNRWPRAVAASPLFLDGELQLLREKTGLKVATRSDQLAQRLERLRRQFLCASKTLTVVRPVYAANGSRQPPAAALSLLGRTIKDAETTSENADLLAQDLHAIPTERWPFAHRVVKSKPPTQLTALPPDGVLRLNSNLLRRRDGEDGRMRPQSPSRLETLLVSPLAWSLSELNAEPVTWAPESLNVMLSGTIAHDVLEFLFPGSAPLPDHDQIEEAVPELLRTAIRKYAPFLQRAIWSVEREGLEREIRTAAKVWRDTLMGLGATVINNEVDLRGEALGIRLRGRADCLLKLADGSLLVVDHKKSGTAKRRSRLEAGWDLQLGLYRAMLVRPEKMNEALEDALSGKPSIGVAYHLINDQGVLLEGLEVPNSAITVLTNAISAEAMDLLSTRLKEVASGTIKLNSVDDRGFFEKTANLSPYALDASPIVARFMIAGAASGNNEGDIDE